MITKQTHLTLPDRIYDISIDAFFSSLYNKILRNDKASLCILVLVLGCFNLGYAQSSTRYVTNSLFSSCTPNDDPRNNLNDLQFDYYLDGKQVSPYANSLPTGNHSFRVVARTSAGMEGKAGTFVIADINLVEDLTGQSQKFSPNTTDATVSIYIKPPVNANDISTLYMRIERCGTANNYNTTHIKIATRKSCLDGPNEAVSGQGDITVGIGGKILTSNDNGIIETDLPPGTYEVTASWKDYSFGFLVQNGIRLKNKENGLPTVTLGGKEETLEVRMFTCDPDGQAKPRAVITEVGKSVELQTKYFKRNVFVGETLRDGDIVRIFGTGRLKWLDGDGMISFEEGRETTVVIGPDAPAGTKPDRVSSLELLSGFASIFFNTKNNAPQPKFKASTHSVAVGIRQCEYSLAYDEQTQVTTIIVKEGLVTVYPKNPAFPAFDLSEGQQVHVSLTAVSPITGANIVKNDNPTGNSNSSSPAWSRGEQLFPITFEEAMHRANVALTTEGYVNLFKQANFIVGHKGIHTAVIMCNDAPGAKQWINIVVASLSDNGNMPGAERVKLQEQMNVTGAFVKTGAGSYDWRSVEGTWNWSYGKLGTKLESHGTVTFTKKGDMDGTMTWDQGSHGHWTQKGQTVTMIWEDKNAEDVMTLSADGLNLSGKNENAGFGVEGTRVMNN